ncbi:hypothetical protein CERSUDRAFT_101603 [Gelatoporia subvermispora B]|uniref:Uncharacterized protein n=1 Tax=Ceriporiopsis subvermispora (strain B) TaxID=914234 RepID=M2QWF0_CERS8|nr:hypothetical protein CERSUDRAFT_101603 [Gelatoporia subvermispora B]
MDPMGVAHGVRRRERCSARRVMFLVASIVQHVPLLVQGLVVREPTAKNAVVRVSSRSEHFRGFIRPSRHAFALESSAPAPGLPTETSRLANEHHPQRSRHRAAPRAPRASPHQ